MSYFLISFVYTYLAGHLPNNQEQRTLTLLVQEKTYEKACELIGTKYYQAEKFQNLTLTNELKKKSKKK